jgi:hypothetical protein
LVEVRPPPLGVRRVSHTFELDESLDEELQASLEVFPVRDSWIGLVNDVPPRRVPGLAG